MDESSITPASTPASPADADHAEKRRRRRATWQARRSASRTAEQQSQADKAMAVHGLQLVLDLVPAPALLCTYESWPVEPPTGRLNAVLQQAGYRLLVPLTQPDLDLEWRPIDSEDAPESSLGTGVLADVALVLAPATAVDRTGTRLGQGGGCYDRTLPRLAAGTPVVALLFDGELTEEQIPRAPHDMPVDAVLQPSGVTWLRERSER